MNNIGFAKNTFFIINSGRIYIEFLSNLYYFLFEFLLMLLL